MSDTSKTIGGLTSVTWGTTPYTGLVVKAVTLSAKPGVNVQVKDENGCVIHERFDDIITEISIDAVFNGATIPSPGTVITYNSIKYVVTSTDTKYSNTNYTELSIKAKTSEHITLP